MFPSSLWDSQVLRPCIERNDKQIARVALCDTARKGTYFWPQRLDPARSAERRAKFYAEVAALPPPAPLQDWLTEAVSGSTLALDVRELLDRCGASELSAALLRRAPRFLSKS